MAQIVVPPVAHQPEDVAQMTVYIQKSEPDQVAHQVHIDHIPVAQSVAHQVAQSEDSASKLVAQPVAQESVPVVAHRAKMAVRATSGTVRASMLNISNLRLSTSGNVQPSQIAGHEWRKSGSGWTLWRRVPSISADGKRSSKRQYVRYVTQAAVERVYGKSHVRSKSKPKTKH